jgi:acetyl-CoA carboxylase biotin carboxylase subunit
VKRVLVANRGEIAVRIARACRGLGLGSVAVYSEADAASAHVWAADRAVRIGRGPAGHSYLNVPALIHVAKATGCDAVHPGYGFLAENADFAARCAEEGLIFVGPRAETIALMGDKARARRAAQDHGVPIAPGSDAAFTDSAAAQAAAGEIGFPLLMKARAGGGGRGMRIVEDAGALPRLFDQARAEAEGAFGDGALYLERYYPRVRHVEVQVMGDRHGTVREFGERDCTVQRRHQKLVEESPSPALAPALRAELLTAAVRLSEGIGYEGAGTVEFIYVPDEEAVFFIEMNTRIQVEHPVTEAVAGIDLVEQQLRVAAGERLTDIAQKAPRGHAIEFRVNAEDWTRGFAPSPGQITRWRPPSGPGIRIDSHVYEGMRVPPFYDSLLAKLIVDGKDRTQALDRARQALAAFECAGVATTLGFHRTLLDNPDFVAGRIHTRWVESELLDQVA